MFVIALIGFPESFSDSGGPLFPLPLMGVAILLFSALATAELFTGFGLLLMKEWSGGIALATSAFGSVAFLPLFLPLALFQITTVVALIFHKDCFPKMACRAAIPQADPW